MSSEQARAVHAALLAARAAGTGAAVSRSEQLAASDRPVRRAVVRRGADPVLLGAAGQPLAMKAIVDWADGWMPGGPVKYIAA